MYALISSTESVFSITGWQNNQPIYTEIPNSYRIAEITENEFPVYESLFFLICDDTIKLNEYYYDASIRQILPIPASVENPALN